MINEFKESEKTSLNGFVNIGRKDSINWLNSVPNQRREKFCELSANCQTVSPLIQDWCVSPMQT